jgi:hypothetical protein
MGVVRDRLFLQPFLSKGVEMSPHGFGEIHRNPLSYSDCGTTSGCRRTQHPACGSNTSYMQERTIVESREDIDLAAVFLCLHHVWLPARSIIA